MPFPMHHPPGDFSSQDGNTDDFAMGGSAENANIDPALRYGVGEMTDGDAEHMERGGRARSTSVGSGNAAWVTRPRSLMIVPNGGVVKGSQGELHAPEGSAQLSLQGASSGMQAQLPSQRHGVQYGQPGDGNTKKRDLQAYMNDLQGVHEQFVPNVARNEVMQGQGENYMNDVQANQKQTVSNYGMSQNQENMKDTQAYQQQAVPNIAQNGMLHRQEGLQTQISSPNAFGAIQSGQNNSENGMRDYEAYMKNLLEVQQQMPLDPNAINSWAGVMTTKVLHAHTPQVQQAFGFKENVQRAQINDQHKRIQSERHSSRPPPTRVESDDMLRIQQMQINSFSNPFQQNNQDQQAQQQSGNVMSDQQTVMEPALNPLHNQRRSITGGTPYSRPVGVQQPPGQSRGLHSQNNQQALNSPSMSVETFKPTAQNAQYIQQYPQQQQPVTPPVQQPQYQTKQNPSTIILQPPIQFHQHQQGRITPEKFMRREEAMAASNINATAIPMKVLSQQDLQQIRTAQSLANNRASRPQIPAQTDPGSVLQDNERSQVATEQLQAATSITVDRAGRALLHNAKMQKQEELKRAQNTSPLQSKGNQVIQGQPSRTVPASRQFSNHNDSPQIDEQYASVSSPSFPGVPQAQNMRIPPDTRPEMDVRIRSETMFENHDPRMAKYTYDSLRPRIYLPQPEEDQAWENLREAEQKLDEFEEIRMNLAEKLQKEEQKKLGMIKGIRKRVRDEKKKPSAMMLDLFEHVQSFDRGGYEGLWPDNGDLEVQGDEDEGSGGAGGDDGVELVRSVEGGDGHGERFGRARQPGRRGPGRPRVRPHAGFGGGR